jgi:preprotein translocase subunit YajC
MFLMTRSAKKKQQAAANMRDQMQPGTGVRTIGGLYATVKEVTDDTVLLEAAPGVHLMFAKNAIGAVLSDEEYNRIVHGDDDTHVVPDDASSLTDGDADVAAADADAKVDFGKKSEQAEEPKKVDAAEDGKADGEADAK